MISERDLEERLRRAGESMPVETPSYEAFAARARPARRRFWITGIAASLTLCAIVGTGVVRLVGATNDRAGRVVRPASGDVLTLERVEPVLRAFATDVRNERAAESWRILTPRARAQIGDRETWARQIDQVAYLYTWIGRVPTDFQVTPLTRVSAVVVAAEEEPRGGRWLLTTVPVRDVAGEVRIDLDVDRVVTLEPEYPAFSASAACTPGADDCPDLEEARATIRKGDDVSVLLTPAERVESVWFSLGGDAWVAAAGLSPAGGPVRAVATVEGEGIPQETIMVVAIARADGGIDTYGYRVMFDE